MEIKGAFQNIWRMSERLDAISISQGLILSALNESGDSTNHADYEFKVFSQWGEDGIIQYIAKAIELTHTGNDYFIPEAINTFYLEF